LIDCDPADGPLIIPRRRAPIFYLMMCRVFLAPICAAMVLFMTLIFLTSPAPSDRIVAPVVAVLFGLLGGGAWWLSDPATYGLVLDDAGFTSSGPWGRRRALWPDVGDIVAAPRLNVVAVVDVGAARPLVVQGWYQWPAADIIAAMQKFRQRARAGGKPVTTATRATAGTMI
jgi:hypothetical protein